MRILGIGMFWWIRLTCVRWKRIASLCLIFLQQHTRNLPKYEYSENPFSETVHARNFVRVAWEATVDRRSRASHLMESRGQKLGRSLEAIRLHDRRGC